MSVKFKKNDADKGISRNDGQHVHYFGLKTSIMNVCEVWQGLGS